MYFIEVNDVVKQYSGHRALDHVSLRVPEGSIYGLLGPNGAGKTSLLRIINMITAPDQGEVLIEGRPQTRDDVARIGYLPEERGLYKKMRVGEHIVYLARLKGMSRADANDAMLWWLNHLGLADWRKRKVEELSKGMQQKVQFIATVLHRPRLLIFDEPFSGFDPVNADQLKQEILRLRDDGATILFSTHNMESVEQICEGFSLINKAKVVLEGSVDEVKQRYKKHLYSIQLGDGATLQPDDALYTIEAVDRHATTIRLTRGVEFRDVLAALNSRYRLTGFQELLPSMHDIFVETVAQPTEPIAEATQPPDNRQ